MRLSHEYRRPFYFSLAAHVVLFIALLWHIANIQYGQGAPVTTIHIIQATAVSQKTVDQTFQEIKAIKDRAQEQKLAKIKAEQRHARYLAEQRALHLKQVRAAKLQALKEQAHLKKLAKLKQLEKIQTQQMLHNEQLALQKKSQQLQKQLLSKQLNQELHQVDQAKKTALQGVINQYKSQIIRAISERWIVPQNLAQGVYCQLLIHVAPGGVVMDVTLLKSSGSTVLDRSARTAVFKASPLPVPQDPSVFDHFRTLRLTVRPMNGQAVTQLS